MPVKERLNTLPRGETTAFLAHYIPEEPTHHFIDGGPPSSRNLPGLT
jgi:hypothetical protein